MNRRGFLGTLVAVAAAPLLPTPKPEPVPLAFDPDAFLKIWDNGEARYVRTGDIVTVNIPKRLIIYRGVANMK